MFFIDDSVTAIGCPCTVVEAFAFFAIAEDEGDIIFSVVALFSPICIRDAIAAFWGVTCLAEGGAFPFIGNGFAIVGAAGGLLFAFVTGFIGVFATVSAVTGTGGIFCGAGPTVGDGFTLDAAFCGLGAFIADFS